MFPALMNNLRASLPTSRVTAYVAVPVAASPSATITTPTRGAT